MAVNKVVYGGQELINLTTDTVEPQYLAKGKIAHDKSGAVIEGTNTYDADTSDATANASEILSGQTAYVNGNKVTGEMTNNGAIEKVIKTKDESIAIPSGYHDGSGTVAIDGDEAAKIKAENIKAGVTILGVTGTHSGAENVRVQDTKSVTPYTNKAQTITPDSGYDYLAQVEVAQIKYVETENPQGGITVEIGEKSV